MHLTANELIMLLQIYRGTLKEEKKIGTFKADIRRLIMAGFVEGPADVDAANLGIVVTEAGTARVMEALQ